MGMDRAAKAETVQGLGLRARETFLRPIVMWEGHVYTTG